MTTETDAALSLMSDPVADVSYKWKERKRWNIHQQKEKEKGFQSGIP